MTSSCIVPKQQEGSMTIDDISDAVQEARRKRSFKLKINLRPRPDDHLLSIIRAGVVTVDPLAQSQLEETSEPVGSLGKRNRVFVLTMPDDFDEHVFAGLAPHVERIEAID